MRQLLGKSSKRGAPPGRATLPLSTPLQAPTALPRGRGCSKPQTASSTSTKGPGAGYFGAPACGGARGSLGMRGGCADLWLLLGSWAMRLCSPAREEEAVLGKSKEPAETPRAQGQGSPPSPAIRGEGADAGRSCAGCRRPSHRSARLRADALETEQGRGTQEPPVANAGPRALQPRRSWLQPGPDPGQRHPPAGKRSRETHPVLWGKEIQTGINPEHLPAGADSHAGPAASCSSRAVPPCLSFPSYPLQELFPRATGGARET